PPSLAAPTASPSASPPRSRRPSTWRSWPARREQRARRTAMAIRPVSDDGGSRASASPAYEHIPPHNVEAEESVLGSVLLFQDANPGGLELPRGGDVYR